MKENALLHSVPMDFKSKPVSTSVREHSSSINFLTLLLDLLTVLELVKEELFPIPILCLEM